MAVLDVQSHLVNERVDTAARNIITTQEITFTNIPRKDYKALIKKEASNKWKRQ